MPAIEMPKPTSEQEVYLREIQEHTERGHDPSVVIGGPIIAERRCMFEDESMADFERRYRPRSDGSPGREVECETCGGVWSIGLGGRPAQCRRPLR